VGLVFVSSGADKVLHGPAYATAYFESLGVPWPELTGPVVSWLELAAGLLVLLGLATVVSASILAAEMLTALFVVRVPEAAAAPSLVDAVVAIRLELILAAAAGALALIGPGAISVDERLASWWRSRREKEATAIPGGQN
jgi:putative oxidoreductase